MPLKPSLVGSPDMCLCMKLKHMQLHRGIWDWMMSPSKYVQEVVRIFEEYVAKCPNKGYRLPKRAENSFTMGYCPKLDVSQVLGPDEASFYQSS